MFKKSSGYILRKIIYFIFSFHFLLLLVCCNSDDDLEICLNPTDAIVSEIGTTSVLVTIEATNTSQYIVRFGLAGANPETGLSMVSSDSPDVIVDQLMSGETYDFYASVLCTNGIESEAIALQNIMTITEMAVACFPPINISAEVIDYNEALVSWEASANNELSYEIEYGFTDFELGDGIVKPAFETELLLDALVVGTSYDYYIRSYCKDEISASDGPYMFTTRACVLPSDFMVSEIAATTALASWEGNGEVSWELEYGESGFDLGDGEVIFLGETEVGLEGLIPLTTYDAYLRANCGPNGRSEYLGPVTFTTL